MSDVAAALNKLREELPFLRRCGRALTGETRLADVGAVELMEELLRGVVGPSGEWRRIDTYRRYFEILSASALIEGARSFEERYSPVCRQAHWLKIVEGFSEDAIAEVLQLPVSKIRNLIASHEARTAEQPRTGILIIEDEALIAHDLKRIVVAMGHKVTGVARTRSAALGKYYADRPALILSDIRLADESSGIDAVDDIHAVADVPVVFITAFPERLLTGARDEPTFLINKPYEPAIVKAAVSQALYLAGRSQSSPSRLRKMALAAREQSFSIMDPSLRLVLTHIADAYERLAGENPYPAGGPYGNNAG
jgi:CheY-like chemotaxis protein